MSRGKVSLGTQALVIEALGACPSQTTAHTCTAPVQAPLSQLVLEWDFGVGGEDKELGSPGMANVLQDLTRQSTAGGVGLSVCVCRKGGGWGQKGRLRGRRLLGKHPSFLS